MKRIQLFEQFIKEGKFDKPIKLSVKKSRKNPYTFSHKMDNDELYKLFFIAMGKEVADKEELDGYKDTDYKKARIDIFNIMMSRGANPYRDKRTWADDWEEEEYDIDEQFVNEALKVGRDQDLANEIIAVLYAERDTPEGEALKAAGGMVAGGSTTGEEMYLSIWNKDSVKALHGSKVRVPGKVMLGTLIGVAADNGKSYYFDGGVFVEGDKDVKGAKVGMDFRDFVDILVKKKIINKPTY